MQNFIELYELLTVRPEMLPFSRNIQTIKMFGVPPPPPPPEHFAIGYVHNNNLPRGNIALQYVIQNNCMNVWWCFLMISCTFWRSGKKLLNSPKLSCGFKAIMKAKFEEMFFSCTFFSSISHLNFKCSIVFTFQFMKLKHVGPDISYAIC